MGMARNLKQHTQMAPHGPPLAEILRPQRLADVAGQDHLLGPDGAITYMLRQGTLRSLIFWGPPGTGKTTIARLLAKEAGLDFVPLSALGTPVAELRKIFDAASDRKQDGFGTLLFMDEIHRYNRAQQDQFLPYVENGTVTLIGATTENPSFVLNGALLSRCQVLTLQRLDSGALDNIMQRAEAEIGHKLPLTDDARNFIINIADGDGRYLLSLVEQLAALNPDKTHDVADLGRILQRRAALHDRAGDGHYNLLSALHKTIRGSDVNAALFYLARLLTGGEDPRVIARRLTRAASEDIGMADPQALTVCLNAWEAYERLGTPEGELAIVQATIYLATAPKSNAAYMAHKSVMRAAENVGSITPPKVILNAPTKLMKEEGYGDDYEYDHDAPDAFSGQNYWPAEVKPQKFYDPVERGYEREIQKRLAYWSKLRSERQKQ
jgi:putative ATPase